MNWWTHPQCDRCWGREHGERIPTRVQNPTAFVYMTEPCCWCGSPTRGIYVRHDPETVACHGEHRDSNSEEAHTP